MNRSSTPPGFVWVIWQGEGIVWIRPDCPFITGIYLGGAPHLASPISNQFPSLIRTHLTQVGFAQGTLKKEKKHNKKIYVEVVDFPVGNCHKHGNKTIETPQIRDYSWYPRYTSPCLGNCPIHVQCCSWIVPFIKIIIGLA